MADKGQLPVSRAPSQPHILPCLGAFHGHCVPQFWEGSFPGLIQIPLASHSVFCHQTKPCKQQSLWTIPVLLASSSRKLFPLVVYSHIYRYIITIIDFIWNCISAFYHRLSHTFGNVRNNLMKQTTQKIIQLAFISKLTSKNSSQELSLGIAWYTSCHLTR